MDMGSNAIHLVFPLARYTDKMFNVTLILKALHSIPLTVILHCWSCSIINFVCGVCG